jgi:hypothetical protein
MNTEKKNFKKLQELDPSRACVRAPGSILHTLHACLFGCVWVFFRGELPQFTPYCNTVALPFFPLFSP